MPSMEVALVDGVRASPAPGLKGECPLCGEPAQAKCGPIVRWHWAHAGRRHCDPWAENEGPWHRAWKALFPFEWREVVAFDHAGEKHIADVIRPDGTVIELQNSPMGVEEMISREQFYGKKMVWIVNGEKFKKHIQIGDALPPPDHPAIQEFELALPIYSQWIKWRQPPSFDGSGLVYFQRSDLAANPGALHRGYPARELGNLMSGTYEGHHCWAWKKAREVWLSANRTVVFDFGTEQMWAITRYGAGGRLSLQRTSRTGLLRSLLSGAEPAIGWPLIDPGCWK